ncbi:hypothetical protein X943_001531 [Babesia divergens]|uniref:Bromo domain-containing protein n=1 Tax=Babesia divergens TaxID=32595 RepID=A0AAD9LFT0_BABDI|nr:hypothetical protein X943_001531 [Babesia divergens]
MKRCREKKSDRGAPSLISALENVLKRYRGPHITSDGGWLGENGLTDGHNTTALNSHDGGHSETETQVGCHSMHDLATSSTFKKSCNDTEALSSILYDLSRALQSQTSTYDAFQLLYNAVNHVKEKERAIKVIKGRRCQHNVPRNLYQQLMARRMNRKMVEPRMIEQHMCRVTRRFERAINVWGHHCCLDEIDDNKPYNEPPQVRCIRFDRTGHVIITAGDEGIIKLWHSFNCTLITSLRKHTGGIMCLDIHPNNFFIVSCCDGGELWLWEINGNLYRPHRRITIPFKYLWCRFMVNGGSRNPNSIGDRCDEELRNTMIVSVSANSKLTIYRMTDLLASSSGSNITNEVQALYTVDLFNHNIRAYDISRPLMHDKSSLIALGIEPMFLEELRMCDDATSSALALLQREAMAQEEDAIRGKYGKISSAALCLLLNVSNGNIITPNYGRDGNGMELDTHSVSSAANHEASGDLPQDQKDTDFCACDIKVDLITDPAGNCKCCLKRVRSITFPYIKTACLEEYPIKLQTEFSEGDMDIDAKRTKSKVATSFDWNSHTNDLEMYISHAVASYDFGSDITTMEMVRFGPSNMPLGRLTSTVVFPSYMEDPSKAQESGNGDNTDPGDFDKLIYHVQRGHETSPDVCFSNHSLNHITASDDGKIYLWVQKNQSTKFTSTAIFTKCVNKWLCKPDSTATAVAEISSVMDPAFILNPQPSDGKPFSTFVGNESLKPIEYDNLDSERCLSDGCAIDAINMGVSTQATDLGVCGMLGATEIYDTDTVNNTTSVHTISTTYDDSVVNLNAAQEFIREVMEPLAASVSTTMDIIDDADAFTTDEPLKQSMMEVHAPDECQLEGSSLFKVEDAEKQKVQEAGHHYVITDICWSRSDKYIFIADSIVTRYNVKKLITASRTIVSGISVFNSKGDRVADFLHSDISHHVGCVKPHPISDDMALAITYGGIIYVFDVESQTIIKRFDCGPNAVWLDADWHPTGSYFAACQSYGCFSLFAMDGSINQYRSTLNHQCGYSDLLSVNPNTLYHGTENDSVQMRRYYYGSSLMPPLELQGKRSDESMRMYTVNTVSTVLDEHRYEVLYVSNDVPMQVEDTAIWSNHILYSSSVPVELSRLINVIGRIPLEVGIIEFIQWHCSTYSQCDLSELILWYIRVNKLTKLVENSMKDGSDRCPYGGKACHVCLHIATVDERAERFSQITSGYRGVKSKVNERGDIIACLPIAARPQLSTQHAAPTTGERRGVMASPPNRMQTTTTGMRTQPTNRYQVTSRSYASSRMQEQSRPQATRIQPPRGHKIRHPSTSMAIDTASCNNLPTTPTRSQSSCRRTLTRRLRSASMANTLVDQDTPTDKLSTASSSDLRKADVVDDVPARKLSHEGKIDESYDDDSMQEHDGTNYSFRSRKSVKDLQREREIERARYISSLLGPLGLSQLAWKEPNIQDIPCALCGVATETSRSKRTSVNKVWIGGSLLAKNAVIGPFATTKRFMNTLEDEFPKIFDRLGKSLFMHNGCLAVATYLQLDPTCRRIVNFPEVMVRGLYTKCAYCSGNFATLHCCYPDCLRAFHLPCAIASFEDEAYQRRQPTAQRNPSFLTRLYNIPHPHMSDRFLCLDCTLKSWVDGSPSLEPFCTGEMFRNEQHREWFYGDNREEWPTLYSPQGGDLIVVSGQSNGHMKANSAAMWSFQAKSQLLVVKKLDYRFCGPLAGQFCICAAMSLQSIEDKKRIPMFYHPGLLTAYPLIELMMGLWRLSKLSPGDLVKVRHAAGWKDAVIASVNKPYVCGRALEIVPGNYGILNVSRIAKAAVNMGTSCIQVEPDADRSRKWFSAWEVICGTAEESKLLEDIKQELFPPEAKEQIVNLTLDPEYVDFNSIPTCEEATEAWVATYWMTIANPMSLEKVRNRILNSYYICPQGAIADLDIIVQNCKLFNDPTSYICEILKTLERAISSLREDLRRIMNTEKYAKTVMEKLWPSIEPFFAKPEDEPDAEAINENSAKCDDEASTKEGIKHAAARDLDDDDDIPLRRSYGLIKSMPPTVESDSPQCSAQQSNIDDAEPRIPDGSMYGTRRSSRLAQSAMGNNSMEVSSSSLDITNSQTDRDVDVEKSSLHMTDVETKSSKENSRASHETDLNLQSQRRRSSRAAEIARREAERIRLLEIERKEKEILEKAERYSSVRYNLRER